MALRNYSKLYQSCKIDPAFLAATAKKELNLESECPVPSIVPQQPVAPKLAPPYTKSTNWGEDKAVDSKGKQNKTIIPP